MTMQKIFHFNKGGISQYPRDLEKNYTVSGVLGKGSFAVVRKCTDKRTNTDYALKIISKKVIKGKEQMLTTELDVLKQVDHPNLVTLHDLFETKDNVYIITDLANGGELYSQLEQKGNYTEKDAAHLVEQILQGVIYLHDHDIVHRDLKPENLLFSGSTSSNSKLMITDFGLSKILKHHDDILMTACGTPGYVAPEVLNQKGYSKPCDIWSLGVVLYTILCGYTPFWGQDQATLFDSILKGKYDFDEDYWDHISDEAKDLINKMLTYKPDERITAHNALKHPWFEYATKLAVPQVNTHTVVQSRAKLKKAIHVIQGVTRMRRISKAHVNNDKYNNIFDDYTNGVIGVGVGHGINTIEEKNESDPNISVLPLGSSSLFGTNLPAIGSNNIPTSGSNKTKPVGFFMHSNSSELELAHLNLTNLPRSDDSNPSTPTVQVH
ncbi:Pkinase-domain-containing protein [Gigaspora margarita]|uniref:Pkinase-domain-containing protein n=1 Tax=Gigaspora margarita TaxID=4874 RepID=A0A8H3XBE0_GIGMA|nr:Pkinase-domain-containing protein [Gigaspora margarita]